MLIKCIGFMRANVAIVCARNECIAELPCHLFVEAGNVLPILLLK